MKRSVIGVLGAIALFVALGTSQIQASSLRVRLQDRCDPVSFNAAVGPGVCAGAGNVTFAEFLARLPHPKWRFDVTDGHIDVGDNLRVVNEGGELHTFAEVAAFGGGCDLPGPGGVFGPNPFNAPLGLTAVPECPAVKPALFGMGVASLGGTSTVNGLTEGTHRFQCLIHPWMRSTIEVRSAS